MRVLWTFLKFALAIAIGIPLLLIVLTTAFGIFGAVAALAALTLRLAVVCLLVYGVVRLGISLFSGGSRRTRNDKAHEVREVKSLPPKDPHYEAAMREIDEHIGESARYR